MDGEQSKITAEGENDANDEFTASFHRRWYVYAIIPGLFLFAVVFGLVSAATPTNFDIFTESVATIVLLPLFIMLPISVLWALLGYYWDAKILREADSDWIPLWWLWLLGHIFTTPLLTVPLYLLRRTQKTGVPPGVQQLISRTRSTLS